MEVTKEMKIVIKNKCIKAIENKNKSINQTKPNKEQIILINKINSLLKTLHNSLPEYGQIEEKCTDKFQIELVFDEPDENNYEEIENKYNNIVVQLQLLEDDYNEFQKIINSIK